MSSAEGTMSAISGGLGPRSDLKIARFEELEIL